MSKTMKTKPTRLENPTQKKNPLVREFYKHWQLYLMAFPAIICVLVFSYFPKIGLVMAFQNLDFAKGVFTSPFVGLKNFKFLFASTDSWIMTRNTIVYNVVFIAVNMALSVGLALMINELTNRTFSKIVQTIFIMPHFLSAVVVAMIVYGFLEFNNGYVNGIMESMGKMPGFWYTNTKIWPGLFVFIHAWKAIGYSSVIYTAVIAGINQELYEAAALDGATRWQQIKYITLPHLRTIMSINLIRSVGGIFSGDFGLFYTVTQDNGALYPVSLILDTYIYNALLTFNNTGMSTAAGFYQSLVGFLLLITANQVVKKIDSNNALF